MGRSAYLAIICATAALSLPASAFSEPLQDVAPQMRKDAECMATTLKKIPVIDQVKVGIYRDGRMILPYVSFRAAPDRHGYRYTVAYAAYMACPMRHRLGMCCSTKDRNYCFSADLPGLFSSNEPGPSDWGTPEIEKRWKAECGVSAIATYN
jgi:hypothetical protein